MEKETKHTPEDIKKEAEEALAEHEGGNLALWEVPQNASEREYWKEVWTLGRMKSLAFVQTELSEMKKEREELIEAIRRLLNAQDVECPTDYYMNALDSAQNLLSRIKK